VADRPLRWRQGLRQRDQHAALKDVRTNVGAERHQLFRTSAVDKPVPVARWRTASAGQLDRGVGNFREITVQIGIGADNPLTCLAFHLRHERALAAMGPDALPSLVPDRSLSRRGHFADMA
jgi:hypothetical protein